MVRCFYLTCPPGTKGNDDVNSFVPVRFHFLVPLDIWLITFQETNTFDNKHTYCPFMCVGAPVMTEHPWSSAALPQRKSRTELITVTLWSKPHTKHYIIWSSGDTELLVTAGMRDKLQQLSGATEEPGQYLATYEVWWGSYKTHLRANLSSSVLPCPFSKVKTCLVRLDSFSFEVFLQ